MVKDNISHFSQIKSVNELYCELIDHDTQLDFLKKFSAGKKHLFYLGLNPDPQIISHNRQYFRTDKSKFFSQLNAVNDPLPGSDLLIVHDFFSQLSSKDIWLLLGNIKESRASYLMLENSPRGNRLNFAPFYLPRPEKKLPLAHTKKHFDLYYLSKIAFLLDYMEDEDSLLRSHMYNSMLVDFETLKNILGYPLFKEFVMTLKMGWRANEQFIAQDHICHLLCQDDYLGFQLSNHYYRVLYRNELDKVSEVWPFYNKENHYTCFLILLNYLNFLLFDVNYKLK